MKTFVLEVSGEYACFTRPEMKVERVSYDVITPSAARALFEAILWKPPVRWHIRKIEVLKPIRWVNLRRNEVASRLSTRNVLTAMKNGGGLALNIEDDRQQRASLFLRDVCYRIHADLEVLAERAAPDHPGKYLAMFERRANNGQCINQPYLGCREFAADFRLIDPEAGPEQPLHEELQGTHPLGWMFYDFDYSDPADPIPYYFNAQMVDGVVDIPAWGSEEVRG